MLAAPSTGVRWPTHKAQRSRSPRRTPETRPASHTGAPRGRRGWPGATRSWGPLHGWRLTPPLLVARREVLERLRRLLLLSLKCPNGFEQRGPQLLRNMRAVLYPGAAQFDVKRTLARLHNKLGEFFDITSRPFQDLGLDALSETTDLVPSFHHV